MFKKVLSYFSLVAMIAVTLPLTALAAEGDATMTGTLTLAPTTDFDPSPEGDDQSLVVSYSLSVVPDSVVVTVKDPNNVVQKTSTATTQTAAFTWDGIEDGTSKIVTPGTYTVTLTATKAGYNTFTQTATILVRYDHENKSEITGFTASPSTFDPSEDSLEIEFTNTEVADITVEIRDSAYKLIQKFSDFDGDEIEEDEDNSVSWNATDLNNERVTNGTYTVVVIARNEFGVSKSEKTITVTGSGTGPVSSNEHITGVKLSPSSEYEPTKDDELVIEFDARVDLDELIITAKKGSDEIELYEEEDVDEEDNIEVTWDGIDEGDDEYVDEGEWRIVFESTVDGKTLTATKEIDISFEEPKIDEVHVSKKSFDPDQGESTFVIFRVETDSEVDINVLVDGDEDDEIVEDMEVEENVWYAVEWDGGSYDEDDDLDIEVVAYTANNEDNSDTEKVSVEIEEDEVSSSKANIINDRIIPVISEGEEELEFSYELDEDADVLITIYRGEKTTGSKVAELLDENDVEADDYTLTWDALDEDGDELTKGIYTYKITAKTGSTETETGLFVIGEVGEIDGDGSSNDNDDDEDEDEDDDDNGSGVGPGVVIDGGDDEDEDEDEDEDDNDSDDDSDDDASDCGGFEDVSSNSKYCEAISWVEEAGIFKGYADGTFKASSPINRAELLKTIMEAFGVNAQETSGNLGFKDVKVGEWYMAYINAAKNLGILNGDAGKGTARPATTINRAEAIKLVFETMKAGKGYNVESCANSYADVKLGTWYFNYVCSSKKFDLLDTIGGNFVPDATTTRGEMAELFFRLHEAGQI